MAHYAKVLEGLVIQVIVAEPEFFDEFVDTSAGEWIKTSYNTYGGVHALGGVPLRKNYATVGATYDLERDAFITPKPFPSWTLDEATCTWEAPVPCPVSGDTYWDEETTKWVTGEKDV
jgi:hypothetical protein